MIDEARLRADSAQIENLMAELRELVVPAAWVRIEQTLQRVVSLYAAGLSHALTHARTAGADAHALERLTVEDELLASLLVLHGLHPWPAEQRIRRALEALRVELDLPADALILDDTVDDGVVRLRAAKALGGGAMSARLAEGIVRHAIEAAAPEVTTIEIADLPVAPDPGLVQIRRRRSAP